MRKEVVFAIVLGISLGLILAFGVYQANKATNTTPKVAQNSNTPTPSVTQAPNDSLLNVVNPQDGQIYNQSIATVSGSTRADNMLTVISENDELFVKPNPDGTFEAQISLDSGLNNIQVTAITPQGQKQAVNLKVVYTTAVKLDENK